MKRTFASLLASVAILGLCQPATTALAAAESAQMRVGGTIQAPRKTRHVPPVYPNVAQAAGVQGVVILEATISTTGKVSSAQVVRSVPLLDDAAVDAVRQWEFTPTYLNGVAVPVIMTVTVNFTLVPGRAETIGEVNAGSNRLPSPTPALSLPKTCAAQPAYAVTELRWERLPIRVYIEEIELDRRGFSAERKAEIVRLIMTGLRSWSDATGGRLGGVTQVQDFRNSDVNVVFRNGTGNTIHDSVQRPFIRHATIMFDIQRWEAFPDNDHRIVNGIAHEMGHVLGIVQHPSMPGTLMTDGPEQLTFEAPQAADINSILNKYGVCR